MAGPPTTVATFLFTDIEGSTDLWDRFPDQMSEALALHDQKVARLIARCQGRVFSTAGDGFCASFHDTDSAADAATFIQEAITSTSWPDPIEIAVRIGIHRGAAEARDGSFFGVEVNRAARIMSEAVGGQILVSEQAMAGISTQAPRRQLDPYGVRRLRGIREPQRIFELSTGFRFDRPTPRALVPPSPQSPLVGRRELVAGVTEAFAASRLVTLIGGPGYGKSRVAIEVARDSDAFPDGAAVVDLASAAPDAEPLELVCQALGLSDGRSAVRLEDIVRFFLGRRCLLVLDNCDHWVEALFALIDQLLARIESLGILATSREPLRHPRERVIGVPPLRCTRDDGHDHSEAAQLFVSLLDERQQAVADVEPALVEEIVLELEGLPLAVELAARATDALSLASLRYALRDRLAVLARGSPVAEGYHESLAAAFDWSFALLDEREQRCFIMCSVPHGRFSLSQLVVTSGSSVGEISASVRTLVHKSLLTFDAPADRYGMLSIIQDYARSKGEFRDSIGQARDRFARDLASQYSDATPGLRGADQHSWMREFSLDNKNIAHALPHLAETDPAIGVKLLASVLRYWKLSGRGALGLNMANDLLPLLGATPADDLAEAYCAAGDIAITLGENEVAEQYLQLARVLTADMSSDSLAAQVLGKLAIVFHKRGRLTESLGLLQAAVERAKLDSDMSTTALELTAPYGLLLYMMGGRDEALSLLRSALDACDPPTETYAGLDLQLSLAQIAVLESDIDGIRRPAAAVLDACSEEPWGDCRGWAQAYLGQAASWDGEHDDGERLLLGALDEFRVIGHAIGRCWTQIWLGGLCRRQSRSTDCRIYLRNALEEATLISRPEIPFVIDEVIQLAMSEGMLREAAELAAGNEMVRLDLGLDLRHQPVRVDDIAAESNGAEMHEQASGAKVIGLEQLLQIASDVIDG